MLRRGSGQPDDQSGVTDQGVRRSRAASWILPAETGSRASLPRSDLTTRTRVCVGRRGNMRRRSRGVLVTEGLKTNETRGRRKTTRRNHARAGWLGAVSCDSDTAPDRRGPRKDAALAGYSRKSTPWV